MTLPLDDQRAAYDRYVVPESRGVPTSSLGAAGKIDFKKLRRPLLITAGEKDNIIPASLNRSNYNKYHGPAVTDFKQFSGDASFASPDNSQKEDDQNQDIKPVKREGG